MSEVVPFEVAMRNAAEVLVQALVVRDFLPSRIAARRALSPGGMPIDDLEESIIKRRDISIANRVCMARADHGYYSRPPSRASIAGSIDRAFEQILHARAQEHAPSRQAFSEASPGSQHKRKATNRNELEERRPEMAFMTVREVAAAAWGEDLGVSSLPELEALIRNEHALRMAAYESRSARVCPLTQRVCHPVVDGET